VRSTPARAEATEGSRPPVRILVGGVGQLYQGDLDAGRLAVERLGTVDLGADVAVEDLHYGAVAVAQRIDELDLDTLILVGAAARGRSPGSVERRLLVREDRTAEQLQAAVGDAVTGYVGIDLVVEVAQALGVLPARTVAVEVEPAVTGPSVTLSSAVSAALDEAVELVVREVRRAR
jgi:hydrogenase maturation protease